MHWGIKRNKDCLQGPYSPEVRKKPVNMHKSMFQDFGGERRQNIKLAKREGLREYQSQSSSGNPYHKATQNKPCLPGPLKLSAGALGTRILAAELWFCLGVDTCRFMFAAFLRKWLNSPHLSFFICKLGPILTS